MWDQRYQIVSYFYGTEPNDFLREQAARIPDSAEVLCLAEGEGRNAVFLASRGLRVTGVDGSRVGLEKAERLAAARNVSIETVVADLSTWELGEARWDAVVSIWAHLPAALRASLHPRIARALRPGGRLLLEHYHPKQIDYGTGGPPDPSMMLTLAEMDRDFPGWTRLHAFEGERDVHEGLGHNGKSFVTQLVLEKPANP
ncbi:MAG: class I SAM-dependent methyltransferase [Polyangiaceae bacterium]